jgi:hypothetical protein
VSGLCWSKTPRGTFTVFSRGLRATVFFQDAVKLSEMGWVYVIDGDFSSPYNTAEIAMQAAERALLR